MRTAVRVMATSSRRPVVPEPRRRALSPAETAVRLGLNTRQLSYLRRRGGGPSFISITTRSVRYIKISVDEWAAQPRPRSGTWPA